jgi:hypothetical protein
MRWEANGASLTNISRTPARRQSLTLLGVRTRAGRSDCFRRVSPIAADPGEGPLSERIAGVQPVRREPVFMPHSCRSEYPFEIESID